MWWDRIGRVIGEIACASVSLRDRERWWAHTDAAGNRVRWMLLSAVRMGLAPETHANIEEIRHALESINDLYRGDDEAVLEWYELVEEFQRDRSNPVLAPWMEVATVALNHVNTVTATRAGW